MNMLTKFRYILSIFADNLTIINSTDLNFDMKVIDIYNLSNREFKYGIRLTEKGGNKRYELLTTWKNINKGNTKSGNRCIYIIIDIPQDLYNLNNFKKAIEKTFLDSYGEIINSLINKIDDKEHFDDTKLKGTILENKVFLNIRRNGCRDNTQYYYDLTNSEHVKYYPDTNTSQKCNDEDLNQIKKLYDDMGDCPSDIYIFPKIRKIENKFTVSEDDCNLLSDLIPKDELNEFVNKNILDILNNKYKNIQIDDTNSQYNFTYHKDTDSFTGEHILKIKTDITTDTDDKGDKIYNIPLNINTEQYECKYDKPTSKRIQVKFGTDRKLTNNELKHIIEEYYNVKIEDDLENYGFQKNDLQWDPLLLLKNDLITEKHLIYSPLIYEDYNDEADRDLHEKGICDDAKNSNLFTKYNERLQNIINREYRSYNEIEDVLRTSTNYYSTKNKQINEKDLKLEFKSIPLFINLCKNGNNIPKSNEILQLLKRAIQIISEYKRESIKKNEGVHAYEKYNIDINKKNQNMQNLMNESLKEYYKNNQEKNKFKNIPNPPLDDKNKDKDNPSKTTDTKDQDKTTPDKTNPTPSKTNNPNTKINPHKNKKQCCCNCCRCCRR